MGGFNDYTLWPVAEQIIPVSNSTLDDGWVIGNPLFSTQWVECSYPISGGYGATPRYIFYSLAAIAVLGRKTAWFAAVSLASVMTYSSAAAVHAVILVALRTRMVPSAILWPYSVVLVRGESILGLYEGPDVSDPLWLPVLPMAWDNDDDPVLAIVGVAFLTLLPMQLWSETVKRSEAKAVIMLWGALLLAGVICALINELYIDAWAFPQLRFCLPGRNDSLPLVNSGVNPFGKGLNTPDVDPYAWNRTIVEHFENATSQLSTLSTLCVYPCLTSSWPLRDQTDIVVLNTNVGQSYHGDFGEWSLIAIYFIVSSSAISSLFVFLIESFDLDIEDWHPRRRALRRRMKGLLDRLPNGFNRLLLLVWPFFRRIIVFYARVLSPIALGFFVAWIEWIIWTNDPGGETFRHIGQWGALVATLLVVAAAVIGRYLRKPASPSEVKRQKTW